MKTDAQTNYDLSHLAGIRAAINGTQALLDSADDEAEVPTLRFLLRVLNELLACRESSAS